MKKLTHQQILSKAVLGVVRQGRLSAKTGIGGTKCLYRTQSDGQTLACGVGQLIDDDLYSTDFENLAVDNLRFDDIEYSRDRPDEKARLALSLLMSRVDVTDRSTIGFLQQIQDTHDDAATRGGVDDVRRFVENAASLAHKFSLKMPKLPARFAPALVN